MKEKMDSLIEEMVSGGILLEQAVKELERRYIQAVLDRCDGNRSRAAKRLGIHRNTLRNKIKKLKLG